MLMGYLIVMIVCAWPTAWAATYIESPDVLYRAAQIRGWWIWLYWISPVSFATRSLAQSEFTTAQWTAPYEFDPAISIGDASLAVFGIQTGHWWVWLGAGVLAGYAILFNAITTVAFTFLSCEPSCLCSLKSEAACTAQSSQMCIH